MTTAILKGNGKACFPSIPIMADDVQFWQQFNTLSATIARIDERQTVMARDIARLLEADIAFQSQRQADLDWRRGIEDRLKAVETAGIAAWSLRKLAQTVALIGGAAVIFGALFEVVRWIARHWK